MLFSRWNLEEGNVTVIPKKTELGFDTPFSKYLRSKKICDSFFYKGIPFINALQGPASVNDTETQKPSAVSL